MAHPQYNWGTNLHLIVKEAGIVLTKWRNLPPMDPGEHPALAPGDRYRDAETPDDTEEPGYQHQPEQPSR